MEQIFGANYYTQGLWIIVGLIIGSYIGLTFLWNRRIVPNRRRKGIATPYFGNLFKRITRFAFREDPRTLAPKKTPPKLVKFLTLKTIDWVLLGLTFVLIGLGNINAWIPALILIIVVAVQTTGPLKKRDSILNRMFAVASSVFRYGKGAELNPWGYVQIKKWETLTQPGETHINIPANWDASSYAARDGFEAHFNTTVTDNNSWIYEWKTANGVVIARPINHIPERADYPGSEKYPWNIIPLGLGAEGEVTVDLSTTPHMLVCGTTGSGKSLALDTPILTVTGWKTIGTLEVGDQIYTTNGVPTKVQHLHPIITPKKAYKISFASGETLTVDGEHLWETVTQTNLLNQSNKTFSPSLVSPELAPQILEEYFNTSNDETIDLTSLQQKLNLTTVDTLHIIAKQVGEAELVKKTVVMNRTKPVMKRTKKYVTVNKDEFLHIYNNRTIIPTKTKPLTSYNYEKLQEYAREVRKSDKVTLEHIYQYVGATTTGTQKWLKNHLDFSLPADKMFQKVLAKAEPVTDLFPPKIYDLGTETNDITYEDLAFILPALPVKEVKNKFYKLSHQARSRTTSSKETTHKLSDKPHIIQTTPVPFYPKKLILRAILERSGYYPELVNKLNPAAQIQTTEEILNILHSTSHSNPQTHYIKPAKPLEGTNNVPLPVEPYLLGTYLSNNGSKTDNNPVNNQIDFADVLPTYLQAAEEARRDLLRGLLDADGYVDVDGRIILPNQNKSIINEVTTLIASLGYVPTRRSETNDIVFAAHPNDKLFGLTDKNEVHNSRYQNDTDMYLAGFNEIISIEEVAPVPMRCVSVDAEDRLFLVGRNLIPTHNSVLQRNLIFHCIQHNDMFRFLGVDVKRVELKPFAKYSETILGIGTNLEDGVEIVRYAKEVMETRYMEMEEKGVNHFKNMVDENGKPPYAIMLMVDEAYMFMATEGAKTDEGKMRDQLHGEASVMLGEIARLGRAAGIHLVLATQRPDATVIRGELKANLDIRIAAGRLDATPSSMVLDSGAATQLPGHIKGRGIVRFGGHQEQFQGYFAEQDWIDGWLAEHPGVEPSLFPAGGSQEEYDSAEAELEAIAAKYDFNDGQIEILPETEVNDQSLPSFPEIDAESTVMELPSKNVSNKNDTLDKSVKEKEEIRKNTDTYLKNHGLKKDDSLEDLINLGLKLAAEEDEKMPEETYSVAEEKAPVRPTPSPAFPSLPSLPNINERIAPKDGSVNSNPTPPKLGSLPPLPTLPSFKPGK